MRLSGRATKDGTSVGRWTVPLVGLLVMFGFGIAVLPLPGTAQTARVKVKAGYNVVPIDAQMHMAREAKLLERQGLEATWIKFESGGAMVQAIATGDIDFASASEIPGIRPRLLGGKFNLVGQGATAPRFTGIYARAGIQKPADLVGKKVGLAMGTISEWYLGLYAERYGVPYDKIRTLAVAAPEWIPALHRGDIDAFVGWEHFFSKADEILPKDFGHLLHSGDVDKLYAQPMYYYMSESLARTEAGIRVLKAMLEAERMVGQDLERAAAISAAVANIDQATSLKILKMVRYDLRLDRQSLENMRGAARFLLSKKLIDREPDWQAFFNTAPLTAVAPERVSLRDFK
jgi:ABC-type nitrate/sulfonate/bicarbonate transport system substrate-binding protein